MAHRLLCDNCYFNEARLRQRGKLSILLIIQVNLLLIAKKIKIQVIVPAEKIFKAVLFDSIFVTNEKGHQGRQKDFARNNKVYV